MRGNITRRGKASWRLKFDAGPDQDGKRLIQYRTVHGTKKDAEQELAKRLNELADGPASGNGAAASPGTR